MNEHIIKMVNSVVHSDLPDATLYRLTVETIALLHTHWETLPEDVRKILICHAGLMARLSNKEVEASGLSVEDFAAREMAGLQ
jgi:tartrate dehydratase beta subunit/fumarate hydratase class I family protein